MTEGTSSSVPIFLCCAEDSEVFLVKVVDALHKEGMAPEVIAGVDAEPALLGELVDRTDGAALFVLCQGDELDKFQARRLTGLFSARKGPSQKIITVQLYEARPLSVLPGIRSGMKEVLRARAQAAGPSDPGERVNLREVVGPVGVSAVSQATPYTPSVPRDDQLPDLDGIDDAEALAKELHEEMVAAEAILTRRENGKRASGRAERGRDVGANDAIAQAPAAAAAASRATRRTEPDLAAVDGPEPGAPAALLDSQALAAVPIDGGACIDGATDALTASDDDELAAETAPGTRTGDVTGPQTSTASALATSRRSPVGFVVAAGGVCALGLVAFLYLQGGDDERDGGPSGDQTAVVTTNDDEGAPEPSGEPRTSSEPGDVDGNEQAARPDGSEATQGIARARPAAPPPPAPSEQEALALNDALADGRMRALDTMLMLPASDDTMTWDSARDHCRRQRVAGVGDWRLPSKTELHRFRRARLIPVGSYWTRHKGDSDDEAIAYDSRTGRWVVWLTVEANARAFCVRER